MKLAEESRTDIQTWLIDNNLDIRGYIAVTADGGAEVHLRERTSEPYRMLFAIPPDYTQTTRIIGFSMDNDKLYLVDSINRNAGALCEYNIASGEECVLLEDPQYDVLAVTQHPRTREVVAANFLKERVEWRAIEDDYRNIIDALSDAERGDMYIIDQSLDGEYILVMFTRDDGPASYGIYDCKTSVYRRLFVYSTALEGLPLARMTPVSFTARDGLEIHGYLTLPLDWQGPGPMVLNVHGGPMGRDFWGFNPVAQWLANRGSMGYGKDFLSAGYREWGGKMQDDLTDAVKWAESQAITEAGKTVIFGESYGGYAAFAGATFTPDLYAGAISLYGVSDLVSHLSSSPQHFTHRIKQNEYRIERVPRYEDGEMAGELKPESEWSDEDRTDVQFLAGRSPLNFASDVRIPMLIAQGANDPRVKESEGGRMAEALEGAGADVEYVLYPGEGHGFHNPANRIDFYTRMEKFLVEVFGKTS
ncbi:S9 family peptidase [bacterium]|nr:S9 family peptidase [bacterium]